MKTRDEIRAGNLSVRHSKRFGHLDDFFIPDEQWETARDLWEQMNSCSCLTLIVACIIYWQAKDISRVIRTADPERHVSPIEWDNIVLYGEYVLNRRLLRRSRSWP